MHLECIRSRDVTGTSIESGLAAALFGTVPAVLIGGIGTMAVAALWMALFPDLRRARPRGLIGPAITASP